jgi:hypothetical protein
MHWLLERSALSIEHKLLLYKVVLKLVWAYDIELSGKALNGKSKSSNISDP